MKKHLLAFLVAAFLFGGSPVSAFELPTVPVKRVHIDYACQKPTLHLCSLRAMLDERKPRVPALPPAVRAWLGTRSPRLLDLRSVR